MASLNQDILGRISIRIPPIPTQRRIACVLSVFNELIEINERQIELLEQLGRSLYREWFVRFRFPGHEDVELVDSELGPIPKGWEVAPLGDVVGVNERVLKAADLPDPLLYLDISCVSDGRLSDPIRMAAAAAPGRARRVLRDGDVVWSTVRPNRRAHGLVHDPPESLIASTGLAVLSPREIPSGVLFLYASDPAFTAFLVGRARGAAYPAVRPKDFEEALIRVPLARLLSDFDGVVEPLVRLASRLSSQSSRLAATRDLLLPRLVTGRLDISDLDLGELLTADAA